MSLHSSGEEAAGRRARLAPRPPLMTPERDSPGPFPVRSALVRQRTIGDFTDPAPRPPLTPDPVLYWAKWALLPVSSIMRVATDERVVTLTYDDGPDPEETVELLDLLAERGIRVTFFLLSDKVTAHPAIVRRMLAEGHDVQLHGDDHTDLTTVPAREAVRRLKRAKERIEAVTGHQIRYYRPTYGAVSLPMFLGARALGTDVVIWSAWAEDWYDAPVEVVAGRAVGALHPGAIVLLHDTTDQAQTQTGLNWPMFSRVEVARRILDGAERSGYRTLPLSQLLDRYPAVRSLTFRRPRLRLPLPGR